MSTAKAFTEREAAIGFIVSELCHGDTTCLPGKIIEIYPHDGQFRGQLVQHVVTESEYVAACIRMDNRQFPELR